MTKKIFAAFLVVFLIVSFGSADLEPARSNTLPVLVGIYPTAELYKTVGEINQIDSWINTSTSTTTPTVTIAGTFLDIQSPYWLIMDELNAAWDAGYVPLINLSIGTMCWYYDGTIATDGSCTTDPPNQYIPAKYTAQYVADGYVDSDIKNFADVYLSWSNNGQKRAIIAPLQEMNGTWTTYGQDPANFKLAYYRIFNIFAQEGIQRDWVNWMFAPNGWNDPSLPQDQFENYYPGNSVVDSVGFSSFNYGSCTIYNVNYWAGFDTLYKPYLDRMSVMAPGKPLFVAEIGTVAQGGDKSQWLTDTLTQLAAYPGLRGWIYFNSPEKTNLAAQCNGSLADFRVYQEANTTSYPAFAQQVITAPYGHWSLSDPEIDNTMFNPTSGMFEDVWPASSFSGLNSAWYADWVNRLANAGITGGCQINTVTLLPTPGSTSILGSNGQSITFKNYCPNDSVTRAQMAVFLERGLHGSSYSPSAATGLVFADVPTTYWAANWIEQLATDGITSGCGSGNYCPDNSVTRAQMAIFLLKSEHGTGYAPPPATGTKFTDVPATYWAASWIEQLANEGITSGCAANLYCPDSPVTRAQMAVFLVKTFNLP